MTIDELRLARAKAMLPRYQDYVGCCDPTCWTCLMACELLAGDIPPADAALGVVSVPVVATEEMCSLHINGPNAQSMLEDGVSDLHDIWRAMLAASPLRRDEG